MGVDLQVNYPWIEKMVDRPKPVRRFPWVYVLVLGVACLGVSANIYGVIYYDEPVWRTLLWVAFLLWLVTKM